MVRAPVAGVSLIGVLTMIAVSSVLMARAVETWDSRVRHELEEDLVFRGEEYRDGIQLFQRVNGRLPTKFEELCPKIPGDVRYVRRCWKDPLTGEELRRLAPGEPGKRKSLNEQRRQDKEQAPLLGGFGSSSERTRQGPSLSKIEWSLPGQESRQQLDGDRPFLGVASDSDQEGFRSYAGTYVYSEWEFVAVIPQGGRNQPQGRGPRRPGDPTGPDGPSGPSGASGPTGPRGERPGG